jgi:hypothetical protein
MGLHTLVSPTCRRPPHRRSGLQREDPLCLAIEPIIGEPADPALVRDVFGPTLGEARVVALIGSGFQSDMTSAAVLRTHKKTPPSPAGFFALYR